MKTNKKKLLSILTAFVMAFTVFGCTGWSFAAEDEPEAEVAANADELADEAVDDVQYDGQNDGQEASDDGDGQISLMDITPTEVGTKSVALSWDAAVDDDPDGERQGWAIEYRIYKSVDGGAAELVNEESLYDTSYTVEGLSPNTTYTFKVEAYAVSPDSVTYYYLNEQEITVKTEAAAITAPASIKVTKAYRALTFTWGAVKAENGGTISYEIYSSNKENAKLLKKLNAKTRKWKKSDLSPRAKKYTYYIQAVEKDAEGKVIVRSAFAKLAGTPKDFSTQTLTGLVSDPGYKAVLLQWNKIDGATGYKIYWRQGGERGNIDTVGRDSDGHWMKTYKSKKTKKYVMPKKPGKYKYLTTVKQPSEGKLVTFDKRGLDIMNHTYVYFYQFMIIPYYDDDEGAPIYTKAAPKNAYKSAALNKTTQKVAGMSDLKHNIVRNNTVLPMYVYEKAKYRKPIYKTSSMNDGKKRGRLAKGHTFICWDKANGRVKVYGKKDGSGQPDETYWFAQKNARTIQGYYMDNCRYGSKTSFKRKDWQTGYSKKTVLDYVNHCGLSSKTDYFIWASKYAQHVYILKKDKKTGDWVLLDNGKNRIPTNTKGCWSNLCSSGRVSIQSRNGHYVIFGKQYKANRSAYDYYCLSKLHKTVRLHSLLYKNGAKFSSFKFHNKVLGNPVTKGCIRMRPYAAQWVYKHVPKKTRTLVY